MAEFETDNTVVAKDHSMMDIAGKIRSARTSHLETGVWLAAATVAWNLAEGVITVGAGVGAHSIAWLRSEWIHLLRR
jgi:hypothetical protein